MAIRETMEFSICGDCPCYHYGPVIWEHSEKVGGLVPKNDSDGMHVRENGECNYNEVDDLPWNELYISCPLKKGDLVVRLKV